MQLSIERLTATPAQHRFRASRAWWDEWDTDPIAGAGTLIEPPVFVVEAHRVGDDVPVTGRVDATLEVECSRCLERYRHALSDTFRLVLEPIRDRRPPDPEGEESLERFGLCLSEELEVGWYRGNEVSLDPYFAEVTALAMPVQPLCDEACAGLCPHCGIDRNRSTCDCTDTRPDSPFAVLAALRGGSDGSI